MLCISKLLPVYIFILWPECSSSTMYIHNVTHIFILWLYVLNLLKYMLILWTVCWSSNVNEHYDCDMYVHPVDCMFILWPASLASDLYGHTLTCMFIPYTISLSSDLLLTLWPVCSPSDQYVHPVIYMFSRWPVCNMIIYIYYQTDRNLIDLFKGLNLFVYYLVW